MRHQSKENTLTERNSIESIIHKKHIEKNKNVKTGWRARWDKFTDRLVNVFYDMFLTHDTDFHRLYDFL